MTLEDVYWILRILVMGKLVYYDLSKRGGIDALCRVFEDDEIGGYNIAWQEMLELGCATLPTMLAEFIRSFLCPDHRSKGLSIGWGHLLEQMVKQGT